MCVYRLGFEAFGEGGRKLSDSQNDIGKTETEKRQWRDGGEVEENSRFYTGGDGRRKSEERRKWKVGQIYELRILKMGNVSIGYGAVGKYTAQYKCLLHISRILSNTIQFKMRILKELLSY